MSPMTMDQLYLLANLAGDRIAIDTSEVEAVVRVNDVSPVPGMGAHVAGLSALRSRVLTIIDLTALVHRQPMPADQRGLVVIADVSGHSYGFLVDSVTDICRIPNGEMPLRGQLDAEWTPFARAIVEHEGEPWLLVSLSSFIEAGMTAQAA